MDAQIAKLDAVGQAELVRRGEVTPADLVSEAIERIEAMNPVVNAVVYTAFEEVMKEAANADPAGTVFPGVPTVVKDTVAVRGQPCYLGTRLLLDSASPEAADSLVVERLRSSGALIVGRSNVPELAASISTEPVAFGATRNPWDLTRSAGGSSGGSAAAVAAGIVPFAHGVDGGGSVRIPASVCGLVGLKPSRGLVSNGPFVDVEGLSVHSMLTRTVRDTAAALDTLAGPSPGDIFFAPMADPSFRAQLELSPAPLRIGFWSPGGDFPVPVDQACADASQRAADLLGELGHQVEAGYPSALNEGTPDSFFRIAASLLASQVATLEARLGRPIREEEVGPTTWMATAAGRQVSAVDYQQAISDLRIFARRFASWWDSGYDLVLTPSIAVRPYPLGSLEPPSPGDPFPDISEMIPFSGPFNMSGLPAITLPLYQSDEGLPIGVQLGARFGREDLLIRVAAQLEQAAPWADRWPPHSVVRLP